MSDQSDRQRSFRPFPFHHPDDRQRQSPPEHFTKDLEQYSPRHAYHCRSHVIDKTAFVGAVVIFTHSCIAPSNEAAEGEIHFVDKNKNSRNTTTASA